MGRALGVLILCVGIWSGAAPTRTASSQVAARNLEALVSRAMETGLSPGMSVAVVRGAQITWVGAFGVAERESGRRVAPNTRFYIGSTSKALTALAAARLAARAELDLDAPLSMALPEAVFSPGLSGDSIRVRDLLTHTHGIDPEGPVSARVAFTGDYENADLLRALGAHAPAKNGRAFQYSNLGYDLIGIILAPARTRGWKRVVEREVTQPLGMRATTAFRSRIPSHAIAEPYEMGPSGFRRATAEKQDANMGPAGGHFSTARDLARLVVAELNEGCIGGRSVIPAEVVAETQRQQATQDRDFFAFHRFGWGLGWDLGTYDGDTLLHRFGTFPGYRSHVSFMPRRKLGVVVLVNGGRVSSDLADVVATGIYDQLRGVAAARQRLESRLADLTSKAEKLRAAIAAELERRALRARDLGHPLEAYAGTYANPAWGTLELRARDGHLEAVMGVAHSPAEVYDAAKNQLRVELFGGGDVMEVRFDEGDPQAREVRLSGAIFERKPATVP